MAGTSATLSGPGDRAVVNANLAAGSELPVTVTPWQAFLQTQHALFDNEGVSGFADQEEGTALSLTADTLVDLSHYGVIEIGGVERQAFLHGLCTTDVRLLSPASSQFSAWCDAKGRALATFWLIAQPDTILMLLPQRLLPQVLEKLRMYVLRAKVTLTDRSVDSVRIGVSGQRAEARLAEYWGTELPTAPGATIVKNGMTLVRMVGSVQPRWLLLGSQASVQTLWLALVPEVTPAGHRRWTLLNILASVPDLEPATVAAFLPQMLGMESLGGLNFIKGCYPGQEVIARLHYRGKLTRGLRIYHAQSQSDVQPGSSIFCEASTEEQPVGRVVTAARHPQGDWVLLTVIQIESADARLRLGTATGPYIVAG